MEIFFKVLNSHIGRDSIIRTCSYLSLFLSEYANGNDSRRLKILSKELSYSRLVNRLFDDFPMLHFSLEQYVLGLKEKNLLLRLVCFTQNLADQLYLPIEHVAWAADKKILKADSTLYHFLTTCLWALSSYLNILRCLIRISKLVSCKTSSNNMLNKNTSRLQFEEILFAFKSFADFIVAVNYLPPGSFMWAGTLSTKKTAFYGVISSLINVFLCVRNIDEV